MAFGLSGNFYEGSIGSDGLSGCDTQVMDVSIDGGKTFQFSSNPIVCNGTNCGFVSAARPNGVPDQEHIAADRFNAGPAPLAGDQVYVVWRDSGYGIVCSTDSGKTWTSPAIYGPADFPRVAVGLDGLVYVIYTNGDNIEVDRFSSCANGLTQLNSGGLVAASTAEVVCPVAGLDRCGGLNGVFRNDLRGPTVVVDDTNASHIYAVYATNTLTDGSGNGVNEDVVVADSYDNGNTWSTPIPVNSGINARRYLPWVCSVGGTAYASWFDRRNATPITNDASDYFAGSAAPSGGILTAQPPDFQINAPATSDPQCGIPYGGFWPTEPDKSTYSTSCYVTPQLAGLCSDGVTRCDFNTPPAGCGTCATGGGQPKYGDYNGNACAAGRLYSVWGSATAQPDTTAPAANNINLFFSQKLVCCVPQIQIPGPVSLNTCQGSSTTATANICNTGVADLTINAISSSNSQVSVTTPSSSYPVTISADSCFPFQVQFKPTGTGTTNATLTVSSNDTVNPSATVQVNGDSPAPSINATEANGGSFGNVCSGSQSIQNIQITNQSSCNLVISNIATTSNFLPPEVSLPLTLTADATVSLPITFVPSTCSNSTIVTGTVTITSNDPVNGTLFENVSGVVPCPNISATIANGGSFGNVCAGNQGGSNLQVLNTGQCNLTIKSVSSGSPAFVPPTVTSFPLVLSADANVNLPITFSPSGVCSSTPQSSTITIVSNDPSHPSLVEPVSGIEGCPKLVLSPPNLTGVFAYPATVSDPTGNLGCYTDRQITVGNSGICPLTITSLTTMNGLDGLGLPLPASPLEFKVVSPTAPISIGPGAAPVPITVRFKPLILTDQNPMAPDQQTGTLTIVSNDPVLADNTAGLCGEPTYHSGARVLVLDATGTPINPVKSVSLSSKGLKPNVGETLMPAPLGSASVCGNTILYHLDNETLPPAGTTGSNPKASYDVTAKQGSTQANMSFTLGQCQMQQMVLQIK